MQNEPTTALDVLVQAQIINLLQKLKQEQNISILLITHDIALISELADKICIMYSGQIIEFREVKDIIKNPKHPYTQMLISSIPMINDTSNIQDDVQIYNNKISVPPNFIGCKFIKNCQHAMDVCNKAPPKIKTDNGYVKCWLYDKDTMYKYENDKEKA